MVIGVIGPSPPQRNFEGMGMGMGIHREWQTHNDSLTIRECHSPNGKGNFEQNETQTNHERYEHTNK